MQPQNANPQGETSSASVHGHKSLHLRRRHSTQENCKPYCFDGAARLAERQAGNGGLRHRQLSVVNHVTNLNLANKQSGAPFQPPHAKLTAQRLRKETNAAAYLISWFQSHKGSAATALSCQSWDQTTDRSICPSNELRRNKGHLAFPIAELCVRSFAADGQIRSCGAITLHLSMAFLLWLVAGSTPMQRNS